ncbi:MAG: oligosaccharide flippase family protein [Bryobacteraceae bacterium]
MTTTVAMAASRGLSIAAGLISVPLTLHYLGAERYGVWMTISSATVLLAFADLGMGNGVVNAIAHAHGSDDRDRAVSTVSSAFFMLAAIAASAMGLFVLGSRLVNWASVFNVSSPAASSELDRTIAIVICSFVVSLPFGLVQRIQIGFQEGYVNQLWQMSGGVLGLVGLLAAIRARAGLPWLALSITGGPAIALICNFANQFYRIRPWLRPKWERVEWATCRNLFRTGMMFCALTLFALIGTSTDNLVIAHICGSAAVAQYAVVQKLFSATVLAQYLAFPLWPAFAEAQASGDLAWQWRTWRRATQIAAALTGLVCLSVVLFGTDLVRLWVGTSITAPAALLLGFACWYFAAGVMEPAVALMNTAPLLRAQAVIAGSAAIVALTLKILGARKAGIDGVVWGTAATYGLLYIPAVTLTLRSRLAEQTPSTAE